MNCGGDVNYYEEEEGEKKTRHVEALVVLDIKKEKRKKEFFLFTV